jgi:hypothetical protein
MSTTSGNQGLPGVDAQRSTKSKGLRHRWYDALAEIWGSVLSGVVRPRIHAHRRARHALEGTPGGQPTRVLDDGPEPITAEPLASDGDTRERELVPLPDERSQALAALCDRVLRELDGAEVKAAEIRFVVHKQEQLGYPRVDPAWAAEAGDRELVQELRRLLAWSGDTIADVAQTLEARGADLDENAREHLQEEVAAIDADLMTLHAYLADPVDWDREFGWLLAGEVAPFDDLVGDEDDEPPTETPSS